MVQTFLILTSLCAVATLTNGQKDVHLRAKRNWPFSSSQQNADIVNWYYRDRPNDSWWTRNIGNPFTRYVGRSLGDEFPAVRDGLINCQNSGYSFRYCHTPLRKHTAYNIDNWFTRNNLRNSNYLQTRNPYNGYNRYGSSPFLNYGGLGYFYRGARGNAIYNRRGRYAGRRGPSIFGSYYRGRRYYRG